MTWKKYSLPQMVQIESAFRLKISNTSGTFPRKKPRMFEFTLDTKKRTPCVVR